MMLHARNCTSKTPIVIVHNHTKTIVKKTNLSNYNPSILARVHELLILVICILKVNCQILWPSIFPLHSKHSFSFNNTDIHVSGSCNGSKLIMRLWCRYKQSMQAITRNSKSNFIGIRESFLSIIINVHANWDKWLCFRCSLQWLAFYLSETLQLRVVIDQKEHHLATHY